MNLSNQPFSCHAQSLVDRSAAIGAGTIISAYAVVDPDVIIGESCVVGPGAHIASGTTLQNCVTIGARTVFAHPSGAMQARVLVKEGAWIGANTTILTNGIEIGAKAIVRPGSVVSRSIPPGAIAEGNPAELVGYVDAAQAPLASSTTSSQTSHGAEIGQTPVAGVTVHHLPVIHDLRGNLSVGEFNRHIPFQAQRYFLVYDVPNRELRGEHAHRECHQFLICLKGTVSVVADDARHRTEVLLDAPNRGLYLPPMTWGTQYKYSRDAMLLVFASHFYDPDDYIREYPRFLTAVHEAPPPAAQPGPQESVTCQ